MTDILKVTSEWAGFNGAPGYTNHFFRDFDSTSPEGTLRTAEAATAAVNRVRFFWAALAGMFPDDVKITMDTNVDVLSMESGDLLDSLTSTEGGTTTGTDTGGYQAASGASITWKTAGIRNGRRIMGRTFLVPLAGSIFNTTGDIIPSVREQILVAANNLIAISGSPDLGVWARPTAPGVEDGQWSRATSASVPARGSILRSRRD